jgi:hypothetical protein
MLTSSDVSALTCGPLSSAFQNQSRLMRQAAAAAATGWGQGYSAQRTRLHQVGFGRPARRLTSRDLAIALLTTILDSLGYGWSEEPGELEQSD